MRPLKSQNPELLRVLHSLRKQAKESNAAIWLDIAQRLSSPKRRRATVNISRLNRFTSEKDTIIVPGKVLGSGSLEHPLVVAAFTFSDQAQSKILSAKGKCLTIQDLLKTNPKGSNVRIME